MEEIITLADLQEKVDWYSSRFNVEFVPSKVYALHPLEGEYGWYTDSWPNNEYPGVYAMLDKDKNVVYIGKANCLGSRLYQYFKKGPNGECVLVDERLDAIEYIITFAAKEEEWYAILSLEGFLIAELNPKYNTLGKTDF